MCAQGPVAGTYRYDDPESDSGAAANVPTAESSILKWIAGLALVSGVGFIVTRLDHLFGGVAAAEQTQTGTGSRGLPGRSMRAHC